MDFRCVTLIALWTLISGPIIGVPTGPASSNGKQAKTIVRPLVVKNISPR